MKYNAGQKPYRGVVYQSPFRASSRTQTRTYPAPYVTPRPTIPPSRIPSLEDTQSSFNQSLYVNPDTPALSDTNTIPPVPAESPSAQTVPFEVSARAFALHEEEVAQLSNINMQQSSPSTPFSHGMDMYNDLRKADLSKECQICAEEKHTDLYPQTTAESDCRCLSDVCIICMQQHIKSQTESKEWEEGSLTCPICNRPLVPQEIEEYADGDTFKTHLSHMIDQTVKNMPNFTRCPNQNCGSGQVHEGGEAHPFVTCAACNTQFCFRHGIPTQPQPDQTPSQHENMSCDEYDRYVADPLRFKSEHQRQQERGAVELREVEAVARARERMEKILERRREAASASAAAAADDENRKRREDEERESAARENVARENAARENAAREELERREREEREERAREEERRYEEEREKEELERKARADEILRRKAEDEQSEWLIGVSTKGCPRCGNRIEKNEGWYEFCWECTGPWMDNSCGNCFGGPVVQFE